MSVSFELLAHFLNCPEEIGPSTVHFINESNARNFVFVGLTPNSLRLRLHSSYCAKYGYRPIKNAQGTLDLSGKIHVAWCVDNIDALLDPFPRAPRGIPSTRNGRGRDCDTALALLLHPVGYGGTLVDFAHFMDGTRIK